jgi:hypothetical protein
MDDRNLDHLLAQLHEAPLPALPATFQQDVWRTIRLRGSPSTESWFAWFLEPLLRPAMVISALALAMLVGASLGRIAIESRGAQTRHALGLEVFSSSSPTLPGALLSHTR